MAPWAGAFRSGRETIMADTKPILLIGPMGSGKTTVGRGLADSLGWAFRDSDDHVESMTGTTIPQLFEILGEAGFRDREETAIESLTQAAPMVVATGGGAVLRRANRQRLADRGTVVYLTASVPTQLERARHSDRPLLQTADPEARLQTLLAERDPLYRTTAHHVITSDEQPPESIVRHILEATGSQPIQDHE